MKQYRIEKRMDGDMGNIVLARVLAILLAVAVTYFLLLVSGYDVEKSLKVLHTLFVKTLFTQKGLLSSIARSIPIMLCALGVTIAFRMKLWNIGAEGQMAMGAVAGAGIAMAFPDMPRIPLILLMLFGGMLLGMLVAMLAGIPKAYWNVNETILTLMLNYIVLLFIRYLEVGPWKDPNAGGFSITPEITKTAWFSMIAGTRIHAGIFIAIAIAIIYYFVMKKTKWGFEVRVIGDNPAAAQYAGINVKKNIIWVMGISGAIAGLAGVSEVAGVVHRLESGITGGYGFTAVIIAWIARLNPFSAVGMSVFMGALIYGGTIVQTQGVPFAVGQMIQGIILFCVLGVDLVSRYKIVKVG